MKKMFGAFVLSLCVTGLMLCFGGCLGPPKLEMLQEIEPNETAYLIALEGDTKDEQDMFKSVEFLESKKVAVKRVSLSQRDVKTGRMPWEYKWVPTQLLVKVDRSPVTREWTSSSTSGSTPTDQAIKVESKDSIGFSIGINITASIQEIDASKYLYNYAKKKLADVVDENIRGFVTSILSVEFGSRDLTTCMADKKPISELLQKDTTEQFKEMGITIHYLGIAEGMQFDKPEVQASIDKKFTSEMGIQSAKQEALAQEEKNKLIVSKAKAEREAAEEFEKAQEAMVAKTQLIIMQALAENWNGVLPNWLMMTGGSDLGQNLLMNVPSAAAGSLGTAGTAKVNRVSIQNGNLVPVNAPAAPVPTPAPTPVPVQ